MAYQLDFDKLLSYDVGEPGITLNSTLKLKELSIDVPVKVDTGESSCLFERRFGEQLGFHIESGMRQLFGTATGTFVGYGHEVVSVRVSLQIRITAIISSGHRRPEEGLIGRDHIADRNTSELCRLQS